MSSSGSSKSPAAGTAGKGAGASIQRANSHREDLVDAAFKKISMMMETSQDPDDPTAVTSANPAPSKKKAVMKSNDGGDGGEGDGGDDGDDYEDSSSSEEDDDDEDYEGEGKNGKRRRKTKASPGSAKKPRSLPESEPIKDQLVAARAKVRTYNFNVETITTQYFKKKSDKEATIKSFKAKGIDLETMSLADWRLEHCDTPGDQEILKSLSYVITKSADMLEDFEKLQTAQKNLKEAEAQLQALLGHRNSRAAGVTRDV